MSGKTERTLKRNIIDPLIEMLGEKRCHLVAGSGEVWLCGRRVYLAGANDERAQEKIRGLSLVGAYVDEITTAPHSFFSMLLSRLRVPGARLFGTTNPDSPAHWLKKDYLDRASLWLTHGGGVQRRAIDPAGDILDLARFSFKLRDNPYLPREYLDSVEREYVGLWHKRFIEGLWVAAEGAIYDMWDEARHVTDRIPPISDWLCVSLDYGTTNPFHALLLGLGVNDVMYVVAEWRYESRRQHKQLTDLEYSQNLRDWLDSVQLPASQLRGPKPRFMIVDPSAASFKAQLFRDGWSPVDGMNSVVDGIRLVSNLLAIDRLKVHPSCTALIAEVPGYSWSEAHAQRGEDVPVKADDHGLDALRYGCATTRGLWQQRIPLALAA
jgi:PBSX family phage terminase large subunit